MCLAPKMLSEDILFIALGFYLVKKKTLIFKKGKEKKAQDVILFSLWYEIKLPQHSDEDVCTDDAARLLAADGGKCMMINTRTFLPDYVYMIGRRKRYALTLTEILQQGKSKK